VAESVHCTRFVGLCKTKFCSKRSRCYCECAYAQRDCPNGQLTRDKFLEVYSSFFPQGNADKFCEHVFRTFDSDNSGKIDFKEFLQAINITSSGKPEQKLEWAFNMYDVNGDGTIEPSEMSEIIGVRASLVTCRHGAVTILCTSVCPD